MKMRAQGREGSSNWDPGPGPTVREIIRSDCDDTPAGYLQRSVKTIDHRPMLFERYLSQAFFDLELQRMWPRCWQMACREEHVMEPGAFYVYELGSSSFLIVRDSAGTLRAFFNSCSHRGTKLKPAGSLGAVSNIRCPYHGWCYKLDGSLERLPCEWDFPHLRVEELRLRELRVDTWGGFVFLNVDGKAPPLPEYLSPLPEHARNAGLSDGRVVVHAEKEVGCNWKVANDSFLEAYHLPETHPQARTSTDVNSQYDIYSDFVNRHYCATCAPTSPAGSPAGSPTSEQEALNAILRSMGSQADSTVEVPEGATARQVLAQLIRNRVKELHGRDLSRHSVAEIIDGVGYFVFPNLHIFLHAPYHAFVRVRPNGLRRDSALLDLCLLAPRAADPLENLPPEAHRLGPNDSFGAVPGLEAGSAQIFDQDVVNMRLVQEGMQAGERKHGSLADYQEICIRHAHQTLDKFLLDSGGK